MEERRGGGRDKGKRRWESISERDEERVGEKRKEERVK